MATKAAKPHKAKLRTNERIADFFARAFNRASSTSAGTSRNRKSDSDGADSTAVNAVQSSIGCESVTEKTNSDIRNEGRKSSGNLSRGSGGARPLKERSDPRRGDERKARSTHRSTPRSASGTDISAETDVRKLKQRISFLQDANIEITHKNEMLRYKFKNLEKIHRQLEVKLEKYEGPQTDNVGVNAKAQASAETATKKVSSDAGAKKISSGGEAKRVCSESEAKKVCSEADAKHTKTPSPTTINSGSNVDQPQLSTKKSKSSSKSKESRKESRQVERRAPATPAAAEVSQPKPDEFEAAQEVMRETTDELQDAVNQLKQLDVDFMSEIEADAE